MPRINTFDEMAGTNYELIASAFEEQYAGLQKAATIFLSKSDPSIIRDFKRIYDIGCGTGISTLALSSAQPPISIEPLIIGVDPNLEMIECARIAYARKPRPDRKRDFGVWYFHGTLDDVVKTGRNERAAIFTATVLHNFSSAYRKEFIEEVYHFLEPGATFGTYDKMFDDADSAKIENAKLMALFVPRLIESTGNTDLAEKMIAHELVDMQDERIFTTGACIDLLEGVGFVDVTQYESAKALCARFITAKKPYTQ